MNIEFIGDAYDYFPNFTFFYIKNETIKNILIVVSHI